MDIERIEAKLDIILKNHINKEKRIKSLETEIKLFRMAAEALYKELLKIKKLDAKSNS